MGLFSRSKPKIKIQTTGKDGFSGWLKCTSCHELIHVNELQKNLNCCPKCDHHYRLSAMERIASLADEGTFKELYAEVKPVDKLEFVDSEPYSQRLASAQKKTQLSDSAIAGTCLLNQQLIALGALDFGFMGGSMGSVMGEKLTRLAEHALKERIPLVIVSASGGARMQESILSLMQMAKTSAALAKLHEQKIPFISVLTNPTSGGVTASFAALGDIIIAEPEALICFAGPRVIEQVIKQKLPPGAQKSEFLLKHGMIDCIVKRHDLKKNIVFFLEFFTGNERETQKIDRDMHATLLKAALPMSLEALMTMRDHEKE
jgi:acetyl-CoA carboxylase carboxyl transferase subunit beta